MTRDDDGDRIGAAGPADGARRTAECAGEIAIGPCFAVGNSGHGGPDLALAGRACGCERQVEVLQPAVEIGVYLLACLRQQSVVTAGARDRTGFDDDHMIVFAKHRQRADRRIERQVDGRGCHADTPSTLASSPASVSGRLQVGPTQT